MDKWPGARRPREQMSSRKLQTPRNSAIFVDSSDGISGTGRARSASTTFGIKGRKTTSFFRPGLLTNRSGSVYNQDAAGDAAEMSKKG